MDKEIKRLEQAGVIQPAKHSNWAAPVVPVVKQDGSILLCGDCKITVKSCNECRQTCHTSPLAPLHPWEWPYCPWSHLHIDYAGPVEGKMLLVVIDAHSKWLDVAIINSTTSTATIDSLRRIFATHGITESIVSDNETVFASEEFTEFVTMNGIHHILSAPYHPATNGLAEHAV